MHWVHIFVTVHIVFNQEGPSRIWKSLFCVMCVFSVLSVNLIMFLPLSLSSAAISVSVNLFIHLVTHATLDISITVYNLYITKYNL